MGIRCLQKLRASTFSTFLFYYSCERILFRYRYADYRYFEQRLLIACFD